MGKIRDYFASQNSERGSVFGLPLAAFVILINVVVLTMVSINIPLSVKTQDLSDLSEQFRMAAYGVQGLLALIGILSCLLRWVFGIAWSLAAFNVIMMGFILDAVSRIITLIVEVGVGDENIESSDLTALIISIVWIVAGMPLVNVTRSGISSLLRVVVCGGTGWERLNYKQVISQHQD